MGLLGRTVEVPRPESCLREVGRVNQLAVIGTSRINLDVNHHEQSSSLDETMN